MLITVNGATCEVNAETTVFDLLPQESRGTAVAVNDEVVPGDRIGEHVLTDGDRVEIVRAVQGG